MRVRLGRRRGRRKWAVGYARVRGGYAWVETTRTAGQEHVREYTCTKASAMHGDPLEDGARPRGCHELPVRSIALLRRWAQSVCGRMQNEGTGAGVTSDPDDA